MNDAYVSLSLYDGEMEMYKKLKDIGLEECDGQEDMQLMEFLFNN